VPAYCLVRCIYQQSSTYLIEGGTAGSSCCHNDSTLCICKGQKYHKNTKLLRTRCISQAQNSPKLVFGGG